LALRHFGRRTRTNGRAARLRKWSSQANPRLIAEPAPVGMMVIDLLVRRNLRD
jgi:hypothetical protein